MKSNLPQTLIAALVALCPTVSQAIVVTGTSANETAALATAATYGSQFNAVVGIGGTNPTTNYNSVWGTGVLIDQYTVLTASHIIPEVGETVFFGSDVSSPTHTRTIDNVVDNYSSGDYGDGSDLALVQFSDPITDISPYRVSYDYGAILGEEVTLVGYGLYGVGADGVNGNSNTVRYAGTNTVDFLSYESNGVRLLADFDSGLAGDNLMGSAAPTSNEAIIGEGDSGGPLLYNHNGEWVVVGVTNAGLAQSGENDGEYGEVSFWTGLTAGSSETEGWIDYFSVNAKSVSIPEPSSVALVGLGGLALVTRRRRS